MPYRWPTDTDFVAVGARRPRSRLFGLWPQDVHLRSPLIATFTPSKGRWNWSASSIIVPIPIVPGMPRPRAPRSKRPSPRPIGPSAGTSSAGSDIAAALGTGPSLRSEPNSSTPTGSRCRMTPSASTSIAIRSCSPRASRTPRPCSGSTNRSTRSSSRSTAFSPRRVTRPSMSSGS